MLVMTPLTSEFATPVAVSPVGEAENVTGIVVEDGV